MCENARGTTTRAQSLEAPAAATQISQACAVEMHIDDVERHECTVNGSELAAHARALQRSKHQLLDSYRKNSYISVSTLFGKNKLLQKWPLELNPSVAFCMNSMPPHPDPPVMYMRQADPLLRQAAERQK